MASPQTLTPRSTSTPDKGPTIDSSYNPAPQPIPGVDRENPEIDNPIFLDVAHKDTGYGTSQSNIVIVLVGLPARGKTHIAGRIKRYLTFFHAVETRTFCVPAYRKVEPPSSMEGHFGCGKDWSKIIIFDSKKYFIDPFII